MWLPAPSPLPPPPLLPPQVVYLENISSVPAFFSFQADPGDPVFSVVPANGIIGPQATAHATITFRAPAAAHHWRRLVCIVKVRSRPQLPPHVLWHVLVSSTDL